jgi:hypothetical protein
MWYMSGTSAVRVHAVGDSAVRAEFASPVSLVVQPTADGGAYAVEYGGRMWRLDADSAVLVKEVGSVPGDTTPHSHEAASAGWLLYTRERRHRELAADDDGVERDAPDEYDEAEQWP